MPMSLSTRESDGGHFYTPDELDVAHGWPSPKSEYEGCSMLSRGQWESWDLKTRRLWPGNGMDLTMQCAFFMFTVSHLVDRRKVMTNMFNIARFGARLRTLRNDVDANEPLTPTSGTESQAIDVVTDGEPPFKAARTDSQTTDVVTDELPDDALSDS